MPDFVVKPVACVPAASARLEARHICAPFWHQRIYRESISGARESRPGLDACFAALPPGDTLVIWKLDRLGRSLRHLVSNLGELTAPCIVFEVLTGEGAMIDTTTASGRLMFGI